MSETKLTWVKSGSSARGTPTARAPAAIAAINKVFGNAYLISRTSLAKATRQSAPFGVTTHVLPRSWAPWSGLLSAQPMRNVA
jgi:hypothetical protein